MAEKTLNIYIVMYEIQKVSSSKMTSSSEIEFGKSSILNYNHSKHSM